MDYEHATFPTPDVTREYKDWFKMVPEVDPEPSKFIQSPQLEEVSKKIAPAPIEKNEINKWYTEEPEIEKTQEQRAKEMRDWIIRNSDNPEETMARMRAADYVSREYDLDHQYVYNNFEEIMEKTYGRQMNGVTAWQSIKDSAKTGRITNQLADLYYQKWAGDSSEGTSQRIADLEAQLPSPDEQKRSLPVQTIKAIAEMSPMMFSIMGEGVWQGLAAGAGGMAVATAMGQAGPQAALGEEIMTVPAVGASMYLAGQTAGSSQLSTRKMTGLAYKDLIDQGIDPKIAEGVALGIGVASGAIEVVQIASIPGLNDGLKNLMQKAAMKGVNKAIAGGSVTRLGIEFGKRWLGSAVSETGEEIAQETINYLGEQIAAEMSDIESPTKGTYVERILETAKQSMLAFLGMGLPGSVLSPEVRSVVRNMKNVPASSVQTESGAVIDGPQKGIYRETENSIPMEIDAIDAIVSVDPKSKKYRAAREQYETAKAGESPMPPIRVVKTEEGYTAIDAELLQIALEEGDQSVQVELVEGPQEKPMAAQETAENGEVEPTPKPKEDWQKTSQEFSEYAKEVENVKTEFTTENTIAAFESNLKAAMPTATDHEIWAASMMAQTRAIIEGKGGPGNISAYLKDTFAPGIFTRERVDTGVGNVMPESQVAGYKAAAEFLEDGKALIHLTEQSDFSSWVHEYGHIIRRRLPQQDLDTLLGYYKSKDWNRETEEKFVRDFENYLLKGTAPTAQLRTLFEKIKDGLKRIYDRLGQIEQRQEEFAVMPPEVRDIFDRIFDEREAGKREKEVEYEGDPQLIGEDGEAIVFQPLELTDEDRKTLDAHYERMKNGPVMLGDKRPDLVERRDKRVQQLRALIDAVSSGETIFHEDSGKGDIAVIHPASREEWEYQTSYFDNRGPYRHHNGNTLADMVLELHQSGSFLPGRGTEENILFQNEKYFIRDDVEKRKINRDNFFKSTEAVFTRAIAPAREPDYESESGSRYWYEDQGVYRRSDHWGHSVASNNWYLEGQEVSKDDSFDYIDGTVTGFSQWNQFIDLDFKRAEGEIEWYFREAEKNGGRAFIRDNTLFYENGGNTVEIMKVKPKSNRLEDSDGVVYIKHEEGVDYEGENLREEYEKTSQNLEILVREETDKSPYALPGRSTRNTIREEWKRKKRVDLTGHEISSPADVAQLFSVYRNPAYEFFHVIYTRGNEVIAHNAMSTGVPGRTIAVENKKDTFRAFQNMKGRMERLGADGYFLLHNHPAGNVLASREDINISMLYGANVEGYRGHVILDHNQYNYINKYFQPTGSLPLSGDNPDVTFPALSDSFGSPDHIANFAKSVMPDDGRDLFLFLNSQNQVIAAEPTKTWNHETAFQKMRANGAALTVYVTSDLERFNELSKVDISSAVRGKRHDVYLDIVHLGDGTNYASAMDRYGKTPGAWQAAMVDGKTPSWLFEPEGDYSVKDESHNIFFQDGETEHETIVREAVEKFKPVPLAVLEEYRDREWAQAEIKRRKVWKKYEWLEGLAIGYDSWEELRDYMNAKGNKNSANEIRSMEPYYSDRFYKELWARANYKTREETNKRFIKEYANRDGVIALATEIASDPHKYKGQGVPGPLFALRAAMMGRNGIKERTITAAITSVKNNATEIRRALASAQGDDAALEAIFFEDDMEDMIPTSEKVKDLTSAQRIKQALETDDKELRAALLTGMGNDDALKEMFRVTSRKIASLNAQHTKAENDLKEKLGWTHAQILSLEKSLEKKINEAREYKRAAELEQLEVIKETKAELREKHKKRREIQMAKEHMRAIADDILRKPSSYSCHVDFQKEIIELQKQIHGGFRRKNTAEEWLKKSEFYKENPGALSVLSPEEVIEVSKKPLNHWTMEELEAFHAKINKLREMGQEKLLDQEFTKKNEARNKAITMAVEIMDGKVPMAPNVPHTEHNETYRKWMETTGKEKGKILTWRPSRLLRDIGKVGGAVESYFWRDLNRHVDTELKAIGKRQGDAKAKMKELGITTTSLQRPIPGREGVFPANDVIQMYIVRDNERNMKALEFGVGIDPAHMQDYFGQLTRQEIALAEYIAKDFEDNFDRYAQAYAADKNEILNRVEGGYFPMRRLRMMETERAEDLAKDLTTSKGVQKGYASRKSTNSRIDISDDHQQPIKLGAVELWFQEIAEQEHYINSGLYIKEMQRVIADPVFMTAVVDKRGKEMLDWFQKYVNEFANPTLYKFYDTASQLSKTLRNNLAIAYLSCNALTVAKQLPSVALFLGRVGPVRLVSAAGKFMTNPVKWLDFVNEKDPQMAERSMDRVFEELKNVKNSKWDKSIHKVQRFADSWEGFVKKWGEVGMAPITWMDKMATTIGWMAVYDSKVKELGDAEATRLAQEAVLETQPAARAKDLAQLYRSSEGLNWFLMFTNQINQTWNIITADIPAAVRSLQLKQAMGMITGMMISFSGIAVLSGWKPWEEDEPEEFLKSTVGMIGKALLNTIPVGGSAVVSGYDGWMGSGVDPLPVFTESGRLLKTLTDDLSDTEKVIKRAGKVAETAAVMTGTPIMPIKRGTKAGKALLEGEIGHAALEALGYHTEGDY